MPYYPNNKVALIDSDLYFEVFEKKGVKYLRINRTKDFSKLSGMEIGISTEHLWSQGDTLWRLSHKYFGDSKYWWVIAMLNKKPTDAHYNIGDIVYIPSVPSNILEKLR